MNERFRVYIRYTLASYIPWYISYDPFRLTTRRDNGRLMDKEEADTELVEAMLGVGTPMLERVDNEREI